MKLLLVEPDVYTAAYIQRGLREHYPVVDHARSAGDGLRMAGTNSYDVLVVDRMLPGWDEPNVGNLLRNLGAKTPAIVLFAMSGTGDRLDGLNACSDDHLVKPFALSELCARVDKLVGRLPRRAERPPCVET